MKRGLLRTGLALVVLIAVGAVGWKILERRGQPLVVDRLAYLKKKALGENSAANYRMLAEEALRLKKYDLAWKSYKKCSDIYFQKGDENAGFGTLRIAQRYRTMLIAGGLLDHKVPNVQGIPENGCMLGAFIDNEAQIKETYTEADKKRRRDVGAFNKQTGVHHASFFIYLQYGKPFPKEWFRNLEVNGACAQIAFEPTSLDQVQDDQYLKDFAKECAKHKIPILLRFASEMNGDWVPYSGDPKRYIEKFRLVARVMHQEAKNVEMLWCVFEIPERKIATYYPGKDAVDLVGVNVYSVPFFDNDVKRDGSSRHPGDGVEFVYEKYAEDHPIIICEYAASHRSSLDGELRTEFAKEQMKEFYDALWIRYPRVRAVYWLSMDATKWAIPGRQKNNYSLLDQPAITEAYRMIASNPWFLSSYTECSTSSFVPNRFHRSKALLCFVQFPRNEDYELILSRGEQVLARTNAIQGANELRVLDDLPLGEVLVRLVPTDRTATGSVEAKVELTEIVKG
ncbi:MAG: hypothetical protein JST40_06835 [Armatimonadetes bacterium]|nr:hypothetical protein [Armatimonadota bacterium]